MNNHEFDAIIVGSGTSAYYAASPLNQAGKKVAMVDERPYGGTCALRGCQPKKYLVCNAEAIAMTQDLAGKGIESAARSNWQALQALKGEFLEGRSDGELKDWKEAGVTTFNGHALLSGENEVTIGEDRLRASHIILATGATPRKADIPGSDLVHDSEHFLNLPELPKRITFIGGGYISFEFAHIAIHAGAEEVTILHRSSQALKAFDADIVKTVLAASKSHGIQVVLNETPTSVESTDNGLRLQGSTGEHYETDLIIEATGRIPNTSVLAGNLGNVESSAKGIAVNQYMQSVSNPKVYAIGDCAATAFMLATVADEEGKTAAHNILHGNEKSVDYDVIPSAVFTIPSIGSVGLTEAQSKSKNLDFRVNQGTTKNWPSSKRIGETHSAYKVIIDNQSNEIIGAHLARHNASECINVLALAMKFHIKAKELAEFMWAYPTLTSDLKYMVK
jgi:glutathione reductase (NADPH)